MLNNRRRKKVHRYNLFHKSDKIRWTNNKVIYTIMIVLFLFVGFNSYVLEVKSDALDKILMYLLVATFFIGVILKLIGLFKIEKLHGHFDGFIEFKFDKIIVGQSSYLFQDIHRIRITNEDYYGKLINSGKGNFNFAGSNGTDNILELTVQNDDKKVYHFELYNSSDLQKIRNVLVYYSKLGKLDFKNLSKLLGCDNANEIEDLRIEVQNAKAHPPTFTTRNS